LFCFSVSGPISFVDFFFRGYYNNNKQKKKKSSKHNLQLGIMRRNVEKSPPFFLTLRIKKMRFFGKQSDNKYKKKVNKKNSFSSFINVNKKAD